ncbi:MAG TPA: copper homeostasis membrane protein CopD [Xanthobacteraceae bacterium]|nr:copper homeostasis membrane protein CopD [Xanthobacteraceae bacterium]
MLEDPLIYARGVHFAATMLAAGIAFFVVVIAEPAFSAAKHDAGLAAVVRGRLRWIAWLSLALAVLSGAAWLVLTAAEMSGQPPAEVFSQRVLPTVLLQTVFGRDWVARFVLACVLAAAFVPLLSPRRRPSPWLKAIVTITAAAFVGSLAWAGHAIGGQGAEGILHPAADVLHLIAAAAWVGALVPLALLLQEAGRNQDSLAVARTATLRFSILGITSVATLVVTGLVNSWYLVGNLAALVGTYYGRLLIAKVVVFFAMVAIAAVNRLRLTPRIVQESDLDGARRAVRQLRSNAAIEAAAGAAVIGIVAVLGTTPPAAHAGHHHSAYTSTVPAGAAFVHIHSDQGMAEVTIEPGHAGTAQATIRLWDDDLQPLQAQQLTLALAPPAAASGPITRGAVQGPDEAWRVGDITLSQPGDWMVTVDALLGPDKHLVLKAPIVIDPER